ncbi:D-arabinono-1,4-lactone oxidase [Salmonella sp. s51228]
MQFLNNAYPKLKEWLNFREQMDPDQVFVSPYWRSIFEIKNK